MFKDQELLLSHIRARIKISMNGEMSLNEIAWMVSPQTRLESQVESMSKSCSLSLDENTLRAELLDLNRRFADLDTWYEQSKNYCETLIKDWSKAEVRCRNLDAQLKDEIRNHKQHVEDLLEDFKKREAEILSQHSQANNQFESYNKNLKTELKIKDAIIEKFKVHRKALEKELVVSKNVIKNPEHMTNAMRSLNYSKLDVYRFQHDNFIDKLNDQLRNKSIGFSQGRRASCTLRFKNKVNPTILL